jgi:hypothetical protein
MLRAYAYRRGTCSPSTSWDPAFDQAFDLADVIGFNEYFGYGYGHDADLSRTLVAVHRQYPASPVLITENGSYANLGGTAARPRPAPRNDRQTSSVSTGSKSPHGQTA